MIYASACVTGHRKIFGSYQGPVWNLIERTLKQKMDDAYTKKNVRTFISGGAVGVDQLFGKLAIQLRNEKAEDKILPGDNDVHLVIARPFPTQDANWPDRVKDFYKWMCEKADRVFDVSTGAYTKEKMIRRDKKMVDLSDYVIAVWDGRKSGGTYETMKYANEQGKPVLVLTVYKSNNETKITAKWYNYKKEENNAQKTANN